MKNSSETGHILDLFFSPRRVAIIGLSRNAITSPVSVLTTLKNFGYTGDIFIINPNMETSSENGIYPSLDDLVESIDLAVIIVARDHVLDVLRACVRNGIRAAIVITQGFAENGLLLRGGDRMNVAPPLCITSSEVDDLVTIMDKVFDQVSKDLGG